MHKKQQSVMCDFFLNGSIFSVSLFFLSFKKTLYCGTFLGIISDIFYSKADTIPIEMLIIIIIIIIISSSISILLLFLFTIIYCKLVFL